MLGRGKSLLKLVHNILTADTKAQTHEKWLKWVSEEME